MNLRTSMKLGITAVIISMFLGIPFLSMSAQSIEDEGGHDIKANYVQSRINTAQREIEVKYELQNNSSEFVHPLQINVDVYKTDALHSKNGTVLDSSLHVFGGAGTTTPISPYETKTGIVSVKIPENIDSGNYFTHVQFQDEDGDIGISWIIEEPNYISGLGGIVFVPVPTVFYSGHEFTNLEGYEQKSGDSFTMGFKLGTSRTLDDKLAKAKGVAVYRIFSLQSSTTISIKESNVPIAGRKFGSTTAHTFSIPFENNMVPGPYRLEVDIYAGKEKLNQQPLQARWLVDGFVARIGSVHIESNIISETNLPEIIAYVYSKNGSDKVGRLQAILQNELGEEVYQMSVPVQFAEEQQTISFKLDKASSTQWSKIKDVSVLLRDENDQIKDEHVLVLDHTKEIYLPDNKKEIPPIFLYGGIVVLIVLSLTLLFIWKRKRDSVHYVIGIMFIGGLITWGASAYLHTPIYANTLKSTKTYLVIKNSIGAFNGVQRKIDSFDGAPSGNLGQCPQVAKIVTGAWHKCPHCANGIKIEVSIHKNIYSDLNTTSYVTSQFKFPDTTFPGGMLNNFGTSILSHEIKLTNDSPKVQYSVVADSVRKTPLHGFCAGSTKSSPSMDVWCTPTQITVPITPIVLSGNPATSCLSNNVLSWSSNDIQIQEFHIYKSDQESSGFNQIGTVAFNAGQGSYYFDDLDSASGITYYKIKPYSNSVSVFSNTISLSKPGNCDNCTINPSAPGCTDCEVGEKYCNALDECIPENNSCPAMCGDPAISLNVPLFQYTPDLCSNGFLVGDIGVYGSTEDNTWNWACKTTSDSFEEKCSKACPEDSIFSISPENACIVPVTDICPNIPGEQLNKNAYKRYANGDCIIPTASIQYFKAVPDTSDISCPAYWLTEHEDGVYINCTLDGVAVADVHIEGGGQPGVPLTPGNKHTLSCNIYLEEGDVFIDSVSKSARCFRKTQLIEI